MKKTLYLILLLVLCICVSSSCSRGDDEPSADILSLDSLIDRRDEFDRKKILRVSDLRHRLSSAGTPDERFTLNAQLYDEYLTYNSDSAMKYIDANLDIARRSGNIERLNSSLIKKDFGLRRR